MLRQRQAAAQWLYISTPDLDSNNSYFFQLENRRRITMALVAKIAVPIEADATVRKVVLTDRYLVTGTVSGWIAVLDLRALGEGGDANLSQYQKTFQAGRLWDLDCREDTIAAANEDGTVTLWDAQTGYGKNSLSVLIFKLVVLRNTVARRRLT